MLQQQHRFHGHGSLRYVYRHGQATRSRLMTIKSLAHPYRQQSRFAVVVSKKVMKGAVRRNRIRRRLYEVVRHELPALKAGHDVVLIVFVGEVLQLPHDELRRVVIGMLSQAALYK